MAKDPLASKCLERHTEMIRERSSFTALFQELRRLVRPDAADFFATGGSQPSEARKDTYDSTAPWALEQLASGLHSNLSSPVEPWFDLTVAGVARDDLEWDARAWLQSVTEELYAAYSDSFGSFATAIHECYLDIATFGTGTIFQWYDTERNTLRFRSFPLADTLIREDPFGTVDTVHRSQRMSVRQVRKEFGPKLPEQLSKLDEAAMVTVVHCVYPRSDRDTSKVTPTNKPWASVYVCKDTEETLHEGGYDMMPYLPARWNKTAGEQYGRSPAMSVLPDIRMVNAMSRSMIVAAQKLTDPALQVPDDGFLLPLRPNPGGINFRRPGSEPIEPMPGPTDISVTIEMIEQRREMIRRGFFVDWLVRSTKRERQTAQEIMDERNQMLGMLGPIVGRLQAELLGPSIRLSYALLLKHKRLPAAPDIMHGAPLDIRYVSPAAKAQLTTRGQGAASFVQQIVQLQPVFPTITDILDEQGIVSELADLTDVSQRVIAKPEEVERRRQQREQAQATQQMAEAAPAMAKSAKDFASAQQLLGGAV